MKKCLLAAGAVVAMIILGNPIKAEAMANARTWQSYLMQTGYFYEQLSPRMKDIYGAVTRLMVERQSRSNYSVADINTKLGYINDGECVSSEEDRIAYKAILKDHPAMVYRVNDAHTDICIDGTATNTVLNQAAGIASNASGMDVLDKVKYFHDYVVNNTSYVSTAANKQIAYGALIDKEAVCEGYARAFALLCHMGNVENVLQYGRAMGIDHAWNLVRLPDNEWYEVDCTWDDNGDGEPITYAYYLITNQQMSNKYHTHYGGNDSDPLGYYDGLTVPIANGTTYAYNPVLIIEDSEDDTDSDNTQEQTFVVDGSNGSDTDSQQAAGSNQSVTNNDVADNNGRVVEGVTYTAASGEDVVIISSNARIVKGNGNSIPSYVTVNGRSFEVTEIGDGAYSDNKDLRSITIPKSVRKVGAKAFAGCTNLKKVRFAGKKVSRIGKKAFWNIGKKAMVQIPKKVYDKYVKLLKKSKPTKGIKYKKK